MIRSRDEGLRYAAECEQQAQQDREKSAVVDDHYSEYLERRARHAEQLAREARDLAATYEETIR